MPNSGRPKWPPVWRTLTEYRQTQTLNNGQKGQEKPPKITQQVPKGMLTTGRGEGGAAMTDSAIITTTG